MTDSHVHWDRIAAFSFGFVAVGLFLWLDTFERLPDPVAAGLLAVPSILWIYGVTERSWRDAALIAVPTGLGLAIGTYLRGANVV